MSGNVLGPRMRAVVALSSSLLAAACRAADSEAPVPERMASPEPAPPQPVLAPATYREVAPVLARRCVGCHVQGGVAPFPLTTFEEARGYHAAIASAVVSRVMPPWLPGEGCQTFTDSRRLDDAEIDVLRSWSDTGAPLGERAPAVAAPASRKLAWVDDVIDIGGDYVAQAAQGPADDWRCFLMDPKLTEDKTIIGYDLEPTVRASVHHAGFVDAPIDSALAVDAQTPEAGWPCPGSVGVPASRVLGSWAAGYGATEYPSGTGMTLAKGRGLVIQIHYHQHDLTKPPVPDRTKLSLQYARAPVAEAEYLGISVPTITLPPRTRGMALSAKHVMGRDSLLQGVVGHMHLLGKTLHLEVTDGNSSSCLMDIPRWNYRWEEMLFLEKPVFLPAGSVLDLTCTWDNPSDRIVEGGLTLDGEMCDLGFVVTPR